LKYNILDTEPEVIFESMVQLASYICKTPIAAISLVDENRQWFKAIVGIDAKETPRDVAFCAHAILQDEPMVVPNALLDERFHNNPLVTGGPEIRFYAGVPLVTPSGLHLGTLCVIDTEAREIAQEQLDAVKILADSVMAHLDLRLSHKEIRKYVDELQLSATIFEKASENIVVTDQNNFFITANPAFTETTGYSLEEIKGFTPKILSSGMQSKEFYAKMWNDLNSLGHWDGELWNKRKNGEIYAEWLSIKVLYNEDGSIRMYLGIFSDITEKKQADETIWKQANYDLLTSLPNRRLFSDRLEHEIKIAHRTNKSLALLFIDLDYFKQVNDTLGHEMGDILLVKVSERINESIRESDTVARMGGDEFTAILPQINSPEDAVRVVKIIIEKLTQPFDLNGTSITISASIGVAIYPKDAKNSKELLQNADRAMYDAKKQGRSRFFSYQKVEE
jgi:diguanylate cyclase (GGDEF)-like protein/PAS domain S-box-containing protein